MKKEFTIGVSVIAAILILVFGINYLKGVNMFKATNYYTAEYTDVAGLAQSAPVTLNGYKVGIVRDIAYQYNNPGHVVVEFNLDDELKLTEGTKAVIVTDMLGTSSVSLEMAPGDKFLKPGDALIGMTGSGLMANVSNDLLPSIIGMMPKIDSILVSVNTLISDPAIANSIQNLDKIMQNIATSSVQLNKFMAPMPSVANDAKILMGNLNTMSYDMSQLTSTLRTLPVDSTMNNVLQASESLKELLAQLNNPNSTLGALTNNRELYDNLNNSAASLDSLLRDVKKNPKRYINIKVF